MNIIDFIIILVILLFTGLGYYRGFFRVVMNLLEYILSILLAWRFYPNFAQFLNEKFFLNVFFHKIILDGMVKAIQSNMGDESIIIPIESIDLPIVAGMAEMMVILISILILFLVFKLLIKIVSFFVDKLTKLPVLKEFNKIGGLVAGFIQGILIVFVGLAVINFISNEAINVKIEESLIGDTFSSGVANFTLSIVNKL